jgi:hypothetical protein
VLGALCWMRSAGCAVGWLLVNGRGGQHLECVAIAVQG